MYFPLKKCSVPNGQKIFEGLFTEFFSAYLRSEGIARRPVLSVLALFHVLRRVPANLFSLTNSGVPEPLSFHGLCGGFGRYIVGNFVKLILVMFFC